MTWWIVVGMLVVGWFVTAHFMGNPKFWRLVQRKPETAYMLFRLNPHRWLIFETKPPGGYRSVAPSPEWVGPFRLVVPSLGKTIVIFGRSEGLEEAENEMVDKLRSGVV